MPPAAGDSVDSNSGWERLGSSAKVCFCKSERFLRWAGAISPGDGELIGVDLGLPLTWQRGQTSFPCYRRGRWTGWRLGWGGRERPGLQAVQGGHSGLIIRCLPISPGSCPQSTLQVTLTHSQGPTAAPTLLAHSTTTTNRLCCIAVYCPAALTLPLTEYCSTACLPKRVLEQDMLAPTRMADTRSPPLPEGHPTSCNTQQKLCGREMHGCVELRCFGLSSSAHQHCTPHHPTSVH